MATALMERAVRMGAELVALPENFSFIGAKSDLVKEAERPGDGPVYEAMSVFARKHEVHLLAGTIPTLPDPVERASAKVTTDEKRLFNRSTLFGPDGKELGSYDKAHLFDVEIADAMSYRESETYRPGKGVSVVETPFGKVGFSVCYDLRFPELFRVQALAGARVIFVPSAFTMYTGKDHWLALLKARAIENQVYLIAPAQFGKHNEQKTSFGKSCVIDPWGNIIALAPDCETVVVAEIDFKFLAKVRKELPVLKHYRRDLFPLTPG